jgi:hypothetical protein
MSLSQLPETFWQRVLEEREKQDAQWGGERHDADHGPNDWIAFIAKHAGKAVDTNTTEFQYQMIRVAALALAAFTAAEHHDTRGAT